MEHNKLNASLNPKLQLEGEERQKTPYKWHCNGDCQCFGDFVGCAGEKNIDNDSERNCPYYAPEV